MYQQQIRYSLSNFLIMFCGILVVDISFIYFFEKTLLCYYNTYKQMNYILSKASFSSLLTLYLHYDVY